MAEFLKAQSTAILEYDEKLVRRLVDKIDALKYRYCWPFKQNVKIS